MDEKELEEGMTWKELSQVLKEKVRAEVRGDASPWINLLLLIFNERSFFSLKMNFREKDSVSKEISSKKVLDYFFDESWESPILKSRVK
jgi:hypothetical protein